MKIGLDGRAAIWYRGTGIGTYTYQLIRNLRLVDQRHQYRFFWPGDEYRDLDPSADSVFNSIDRHRDTFWEAVHIPARIADENIDLYHVPQNGIGLPHASSCPLVVTVHDLIPYIYPETVGKGYLKLFLEQMPRIVEKAAKIITVSQWSARDLQRVLRVPPEKIAVTYEAPEDFYRPLDRAVARELLAQKYGINRKFLLYLGGFGPRKNVKAVINAFYEVHRDLPTDHLLVLVGKEDREYKDLQMLAEALGIADKVLFPGFVPVEELPYFYNAAEVFVYPSFYEGFGLPPVEAMACGTPVVTANSSSLPEVVGDAAIMTNPYDTSDIAEAIYRLLTNPELTEEYRRRGLTRVKQFSWRDTALQTIAVYEDVGANT